MILEEPIAKPKTIDVTSLRYYLGLSLNKVCQNCTNYLIKKDNEKLKLFSEVLFCNTKIIQVTVNRTCKLHLT